MLYTYIAIACGVLTGPSLGDWGGDPDGDEHGEEASTQTEGHVESMHCKHIPCKCKSTATVGFPRLCCLLVCFCCACCIVDFVVGCYCQ